MKISRTNFEDLLIIEPIVHRDERGFFSEAYNYNRFVESGIDIHFIQDNQSFSLAGVIRGLHFQNEPKAQTKLVRVLQGKILDIVVDLRKNQQTYKMVHAIELSRDNGKQLMVPKGFAHGFSVLSESAEVLYKTEESYSPEHESGIHFGDPELNIDWQVDPEKRIVSAKDRALPFLKDVFYHFLTS